MMGIFSNILDGDPNYSSLRSTLRTMMQDTKGTTGIRQAGAIFKNMYTGGFMRISKRAINSTITWYGFDLI